MNINFVKLLILSNTWIYIWALLWINVFINNNIAITWIALTIAHLHKLQFKVLRHLMGLADSENVANNIHCSISFVPQWLQDFICLIDISFFTVTNHLLDQQWVGLITYLHALTTVQGSCDTGVITTLKTLSEFTWPNPACVDWRLLSAFKGGDTQ